MTKRLPAHIKRLLDGLRGTGDQGWQPVAEIYRRQWLALERRGLIEYRQGSRQHEARIIDQKEPGMITSFESHLRRA